MNTLCTIRSLKTSIYARSGQLGQEGENRSRNRLITEIRELGKFDPALLRKFEAVLTFATDLFDRVSECTASDGGSFTLQFVKQSLAGIRSQIRICWVAQPGETEIVPIKGKIDVFGETGDRAIGFGERRATFEDEPGHWIGQRENPFQGPANPEVLLDDGWLYTHPGGSFLKRLRSDSGGFFCEGVHRSSYRRNLPGNGSHPFWHRQAVFYQVCPVVLAQGGSQLADHLVVDIVFAHVPQSLEH